MGQHTASWLEYLVPLASCLRGQWVIEALHWVRDVSFDEDRSGLRAGNGPQIMAALRNLIITALRLAGVTNLPPRYTATPASRTSARHLQGRVATLPRHDRTSVRLVRRHPAG